MTPTSHRTQILILYFFVLDLLLYIKTIHSNCPTIVLLSCVTVSDSTHEDKSRLGTDGKAARGLHRIRHEVVKLDRPKFCYTKLIISETIINISRRVYSSKSQQLTVNRRFRSSISDLFCLVCLSRACSLSGCLLHIYKYDPAHGNSIGSPLF
jgi:hypothetical protein